MAVEDELSVVLVELGRHQAFVRAVATLRDQVAKFTPAGDNDQWLNGAQDLLKVVVEAASMEGLL